MNTALASDTMLARSLPTSFRVFKPVGHVMVGLPSPADADALAQDLHLAGWPPDALLHFEPLDSVSELEAMVDGAGVLAGFGYEITLLRRYLALAREGHGWLLVRVDGSEQAGTVTAAARLRHAGLAVWYRSLTAEELL